VADGGIVAPEPSAEEPKIEIYRSTQECLLESGHDFFPRDFPSRV